jgi:peptidoglycan/xylan/chitin deacetylase (PgdA/CDA1 family)
VLTFDDGYASNYHLAWPVLREFNLPATIFLATGFLDGTEKLWFQRLDLALGSSKRPFLEWKFPHGKERLRLSNREDRHKALDRLLPELKRLPDEDLLGEIDRIEQALEAESLVINEMPEPMRPMSWDQVRELAAKGLVDFGGHTHTHPILGRCSPQAMRGEIFTCRDRFQAEMGRAPTLFAYPNGGPSDYKTITMTLLREAGFQAACTMCNGRVEQDTSLLELPRYGSPESVWEAEATVSGAFEAVKAWRQAAKNSLWSILP